MAKRFGKFTIKKDARGYNRYYNKEGKRVANSTFEDYQKEFLQKAKKSWFQSSKTYTQISIKKPRTNKAR